MSWGSKTMICSHFILVCLGVGGLCLVSFNFLNDEAPPPIKPLPPATHTTHHDSELDGHHHHASPYNAQYHYQDDKFTAEYAEYQRASREYADYRRDPRLYMACGAGTVFLGALEVLVMIGITSAAEVFGTTTVLNRSVVQFAWVVVVMLMYNTTVGSYTTYDSIDAISVARLLAPSTYILATLIPAAVILAVQIVMSLYEFRRRVKRFPGLVLSRIPTLGSIILAARVTFAFFTVTAFFNSFLMYGLDQTDVEYPYSNPPSLYNSIIVRYPTHLTLPIALVCVYGEATALQATLSHLLPPTNYKAMAWSSLYSGSLYGVVGVLSSPIVVLRFVVENDVTGGVYSWLMVASVLACVSNLIHALFCILAPAALDTPPEILGVLANALTSCLAVKKTERGCGDRNEYPRDSSSSEHQWADTMESLNGPMLAKSIIAVMLSCGGAWHMDQCWGVLVMLVGNAAVIGRLVPGLLRASFTSVPPRLYTRIEMVSRCILETVPLLTGATATLCLDWSTPRTIAAFINIFTVIVQIRLTVKFVRGPAKPHLAVSSGDLRRVYERLGASGDCVALVKDQDLGEKEHKAGPEKC